MNKIHILVGHDVERSNTWIEGTFADFDEAKEVGQKLSEDNIPDNMHYEVITSTITPKKLTVSNATSVVVSLMTSGALNAGNVEDVRILNQLVTDALNTEISHWSYQ